MSLFRLQTIQVTQHTASSPEKADWVGFGGNCPLPLGERRYYLVRRFHFDNCAESGPGSRLMYLCNSFLMFYINAVTLHVCATVL